MKQAFICGAVRTPFSRYGGTLGAVRADDLAALPIAELIRRNPKVDWSAVDDVLYGCANGAGEDNRNVARMAALLAGLPHQVPGTTLNRLCGSSLDAVGMAARSIKSGDVELMIAGGVESMTRAPFVTSKAGEAISRGASVEDTTLGWRFVNPLMKSRYGIDSMPETAENVAEQFKISRADQDAFALRSQQRWAASNEWGSFEREIVPVAIAQTGRRGAPGEGHAKMLRVDEHPRPDTTLEMLTQLRGVVKQSGTVPAGNASGVNDGASAILLASEKAVGRHAIKPRARAVAMATVGLEPRIMDFGPAPATRKVLQLAGLKLEQMDVIELNEASAAQGLAVTRNLGLPDDAAHVNPNGGAIAIGHPLGAWGARLVTTALNQLERIQGRYAPCTLGIGVGQGIAVMVERV